MLFYNIGVLLYALAIHIASLFKTKAKQWVRGRINWENHLEEKLKKSESRKKIWIHCASLGEFEQGRPIIESIKKSHPEHFILLTFFSPSGYEIRKDYEFADAVLYMPLDTKRNARKFLDLTTPDLVLFIKYEFWVNFLNTLREKQITAYLVSAVFKPHHPFFKWYGGIFIKSLEAFKILFVQDTQSKKLLASIGVNNVEVCGDTRFDRVLDIKNKFKPIPEIQNFKGNSKLIIAGSTWPKDEDMLLEAFSKLNRNDVKLIIVPHNIETQLQKNTVTKIERAGLSYSLFTDGVKNESKILVLNTMGLLSRIYYYGEAAYIGGGFNGGIHNCLEPAVFGTPVSFYGPGHEKYNEAVDLVANGAATAVNDAGELLTAWKRVISDQQHQAKIKSVLEDYFAANANSTGRILQAISV
jgi:3-deoxy-D-manno-octulosonic-acid transferase